MKEKITGAEALMRSLENEGVDVMFGYPGGAIGKIKDGDIITIDIPSRSISVKLTDAELEARPQRPMTRKRVVPKSLKAYASMVSSADKGAVRIIPE